jgi:4-aminobutyrate aminotransferase-like enzyme
LCLSTDGPLHNVIKIKPPMVLTKEDIDMTLRLLNESLDRASNVSTE